MDRRTFLAFGAGLLVISGPAGAQTPKNAARVGLLSPGDSKTRAWAVDAVRKTLHGQGWVEGDNLLIEYRYGGEDYERLRALAARGGNHRCEQVPARAKDE